MKLTNHFRDEKMALKWVKKERPDLSDPELELNELIAKRVWKIGHPPLTKYAEYDGRYIFLD